MEMFMPFIFISVIVIIGILVTLKKTKPTNIRVEYHLGDGLNAKLRGGKAEITRLFEQRLPEEAQKVLALLEQDVLDYCRHNAIHSSKAPTLLPALTELRDVYQTEKNKYNTQKKPAIEVPRSAANGAASMATKPVDPIQIADDVASTNFTVSPEDTSVNEHSNKGVSKPDLADISAAKARETMGSNAYYLAFKNEHIGLKLPIAMFFATAALKLELVNDISSMTWFKTFLTYLNIPEDAMPGGILQNTETILPLIEAGDPTGNGGFFGVLPNMNGLQQALFIQAFYKLVEKDSLYLPSRLEEVVGYLPEQLGNTLRQQSTDRTTVLPPLVSNGRPLIAQLAADARNEAKKLESEDHYTEEKKTTLPVPFTLDNVVVPASLLLKESNPYHIVFISAHEVIRLSAGFFLACIVLETYEQSDKDALQWLKIALYSLDLPESITVKEAAGFLALLKTGHQSTRIFEPLNYMNNEQTILLISLLFCVSSGIRESEDKNRNIKLKEAEQLLPPNLHHLIFSTAPSVIGGLIKDVMHNPYSQSPGDHAPLEKGGPPRGPFVPSKYPISMFH